MLIKKEDSKIEKISSQGNVLDYKLPTEDVGIALQELNGRVPDSGCYRNTVCREVCYIVGGQGTFYIEDAPFKATEGDVVIIEAGKKSYVEAQQLKMVVVTQPNWYEGQCQLTQN